MSHVWLSPTSNSVMQKQQEMIIAILQAMMMEQMLQHGNAAIREMVVQQMVQILPGNNMVSRLLTLMEKKHLSMTSRNIILHAITVWSIKNRKMRKMGFKVTGVTRQ